MLPCLDPALSPAYHKENQNCIMNVVQRFQGLVDNEIQVNAIINSWNNLIFIEDFPQNLRDPTVKISDFYFGIYNYINPAREHSLQPLGLFVLNIFTIPHSNVEPERTWSKEKITKTDLRNKL